MEFEDTIVAISTPFGESGIGIVRLSGKKSIDIVDKIFKPHCKKNLRQLPSHSVRLGYIVDDENIIDEVLVCVMRAPKTYTREDIVEISGHGGTIVLNKILQLCLKNGARLASPGEFTKRAFLNGRIDLTQAEAVCDFIRSKTEFQSSLFMRNLKGEFKNKINQLKQELIQIISNLELTLDFSEEDITFITKQEIENKLIEIKNEISTLLTYAEKSHILKEGVKIAIAGKTNVGKSSLLNALLKEDRVIVTPIPGTTRDIVSETFNLNGLPVTVMDTAGIRQHTYDTIEKIASEKALKLFDQADIIIFVLDASKELSVDDFYIASLFNKKKDIIIALNKIDLPTIITEKEIKEKLTLDSKIVKTSATENIGIDELEETIFKTAIGDYKNTFASPDTGADFLLINIRCKNILESALQELNETLTSLNETEEIIAFKIKSIIDKLKEITGEITTEDILDYIFSNFCIGK